MIIIATDDCCVTFDERNVVNTLKLDNVTK